MSDNDAEINGSIEALEELIATILQAEITSGRATEQSVFSQLKMLEGRELPGDDTAAAQYAKGRKATLTRVREQLGVALLLR